MIRRLFDGKWVGELTRPIGQVQCSPIYWTCTTYWSSPMQSNILKDEFEQATRLALLPFRVLRWRTMKMKNNENTYQY